MALSIDGFSELEEIHRSPSSLVLRGIRDDDGRRVVLKTPNRPHPTSAEVAMLIREVRLARRAAGPHTAEMLGQLDRDGVPVLVMQDAGTRSLAALLREDPPPFGRKLELAVEAARAVAQVHDAGVIHKDINPSNLVYDVEAGTLRVIDFGIATELERQRAEPTDAARLEGTLPYVAPEQTGRTNRRIDRRSDLYSLGVTLYELFTGRRPFASDDALELVHAHLARQPLPPNAHDDSLPPMISAIVMRLLAKAAEDRYQTATGLLADLERCVAAFRAEGSVPAFELAADDRPGRLELPEKLYGREAEIARLTEAAGRAADGGREVFLIGGYAGIGKTSLVHEVLGVVTERRGVFLHGKFDSLRRGRPLEPLGDAVGRLMQSILTRDDAAIAHWRERLGEALGGNGAVLEDVLPELEPLLGGLDPVPELPVAEAENRLSMVFRELLATIAREAGPVVLFLDDLQWADLQTLRLLEGLASDPAVGRLLLIGAYRTNEVDDAHPLTITRHELERLEVSLSVLELGPPSDGALRQLLADTFLRDDDALDQLAEILIRKTAGNPFFLQRLLVELAESEDVRWDAAASRWTWDEAALESLTHGAGLLEFLLERLAALPEPTRVALSRAACIGRSFDTREVAPVIDKTPAQMQNDLDPAVRAGLIAPHGKGWRLEASDSVDLTPAEAFLYAFEHDRIQNAAYESLSADDAKRAHLALGQLLRQSNRDRSFEVAQHLNEAADLLDADARLDLARRNLDVGRRARRAAAFDAASSYFEAGLRILPGDAWDAHYAATLDLTVEAAECAYLVADFERAKAHLEAVHAHAREKLDHVAAWRVDTAARIAQHDLKGAIAVARGALSELGFELPEAVDDEAIGAAVGRTLGALGDDLGERLETLDDVDDPIVRAALVLMGEACSPAYYAQPELLPILAGEMVVTSLEKGPAPQTPFGLAVFGIVLNAAGMMREAHAIGQLAHRLLARFDARHLEARTRLVVHNNVCCWTVPLQSALDDLLDTYRVGRETGDFEFAATAGQAWATNAFVAGRPLDDLERTALELGGFMRSYQQGTALKLHEPLQQLVGAFVGQTDTPGSLTYGSFDEDAALAGAEASGSASVSFVVLTDMLIARYHFGEPADAWAIAQRSAPFAGGATSTHHLSTFHLYAPLAAAKAFDDADETQRAAMRARFDESHAQLEAWAAVGPENFTHRVRLVRAERARVDGDPAEAERGYRAALEAARETEYVNDEGLIAELAGRFHLARGGVDATIGRAFLEDAAFAYQRWGATAKVAALQAEFPQLLGRTRDGGASTGFTLSSSVTGLDIDAAAFARAAQGISAAIELDELLETVFRTAIEAAGASRALLVLAQGERWVIATEGYATGKPLRTDRVLDDCDPASDPVGVLRYVLRTRDPVLLADAASPGGQLADDPYLCVRQVRSVLCLPLLYRGELNAVLYLEHDRLPDTFTERRAKLVQLLMAQAAVSLENAKLYASQRRLTTQQSRFVPHEFLDSLGRTDIAEVALGLHVEKTMSVLFSDLRRFTTLVERLGAKTIVEVLNDYFAAMEPPIVEHDGFIDSFNGDEIMALFDGPADAAVRAAVAMQHALYAFNERGVGSDRPALSMGVGVNSGSLLLGTVGGRDRIKCGVVGEAVNLASRLERLTRRYGAAVIVGEATWNALEDRDAFTARRLDRVAVKGTHKPVTLYELLDAERDEAREAKLRTRAIWERALDAYLDRDFELAMELCGECLAMSPRDRLPMMLANRCDRYRSRPPDGDWAGVERLVDD